MSQFSLPRSPVSASVLLDQGVSRPGDVFVMEREPHHDGAETVLEMLNRREGFFAFRPADEEGVLLMSKVHTVSVSVDRQAPIADPARLSAARMLGIELVLVGGSTLGGWASVEPPEHHARLLDYLDACDDPLRQPSARAVRAPIGLSPMPARLDPFVDVLLRERGDQLYLLPDEPVTMVKDGKTRKVSRQPLTDQHIYALLVEVAPSESANHIDQGAETEFEYVADRGMVRVRIVPEMGRLTAVVAPIEKAATRPVAAAAPAP